MYLVRCLHAEWGVVKQECHAGLKTTVHLMLGHPGCSDHIRLQKKLARGCQRCMVELTMMHHARSHACAAALDAAVAAFLWNVVPSSTRRNLQQNCSFV
jgi:hypothetical protein